MPCRDVCGYPKIVHGGLTAAIIDETLGFLLYALKQSKALPFWGPAYTACLEVNYKAVCGNTLTSTFVAFAGCLGFQGSGVVGHSIDVSWAGHQGI